MMDKAMEIKRISPEMFEFAQMGDKLHDKKLETKPVGYFKDAFRRFKKNQASVIAAIIIVLIILYAIFVPITSQYTVGFKDAEFKYLRPRSLFLEKFGIFEGGLEMTLSQNFYANMVGIGIAAEDQNGEGATWAEGIESEYYPILKIYEKTTQTVAGESSNSWICDVSSYYKMGFSYKEVAASEYDKILAWQEETGIPVLYPMINRGSSDTPSEWCNDYSDANCWYATKRGVPVNYASNAAGYELLTVEQLESGAKTFQDIYLRNEDGEVQYFVSTAKGGTMCTIRVMTYNYYIYLYGHEPSYIFGTDGSGYDIAIRLANGIQLSLILAFSVFFINFFIGTVYGAIEGYYGGVIDLIMERISDILSRVPFIIVATLFQMYLVATGKASTIEALLFAFVLTGWLGTAYLVRTQFYRFKTQEYVFAARTLGASDFRLIAKHIYPNTLGTIITSSILGIPGVIFTESSLSYLGIINLDGTEQTSIGTMLANGNAIMAEHPHVILFPALVISLLMISFNLFGNGLRDAFNPSLRGSEG
ncbi:MAG: ABC transporter permease [Clostridia bacterium]|nr:ABC transporter permease [Clostridia bacterium]